MDAISGFLLAPEIFNWAVSISVIAVLTLGFLGAPFWLWALATIGLFVGFGAGLPTVAGLVLLALLFAIPPLRRNAVSRFVMNAMKALKLIPKISPTERTALEAGVVWSEADLFSGKPNFKKLMQEPYPELSAEEKAFIDGPVTELCAMVDDWELFKTKEMRPEVFDFIRKKGFLGIIIPKEYGGLGFSHSAHSAIVQMISTRSIGTTIYIMVPNSLGPAELLVHYGTDAQKKKYLPRLARGEEIPCFGLTEPAAGSDAGSLTSEGVLFKGEDGKIYIRLNWKKRYITLAAISTLVGLAFRLRDPENLLGKGPDLGITAALIPSNLPGVIIGRRHDPLGIPFHNCPMEGKDVIVNAEDCIIGGLACAGRGWEMLMDCLAAGRGISLPAQATGGAKLVLRTVSNYAAVRKQFGVAIGKFEGVEEPLARITGAAYYLEAMRKYVLSALDQGIKPPVVTAIAKYNGTELARKAINDGMDIIGGAGISMGPRNLLATTYIGTPISITVEGANILTRTLMVFGQGALRAHPFAFKEVNAVEKGDLKAFDQAFWGHIGHIVRNAFRALLLSFTRGRLLLATPGDRYTGIYFRKMAWASASFAILADLAMGLLGGQLKVKEKLTGRFADILSWMFIGTAVLRRYEAEGRKPEDRPLVDYSMKLAFAHIQAGFDGLYSNMNVPFLGWMFRGPMHWWSRLNSISSEPGDELAHKICGLAMADSEQRERLTHGMFIPSESDESLARLEKAFKAVKKAEAAEKKMRKAVKAKTIPKKKGLELAELALSKNVITKEEFEVLQESERLRASIIQVDDFSQEEYLPQRLKAHATYREAASSGLTSTRPV